MSTCQSHKIQKELHNGVAGFTDVFQMLSKDVPYEERICLNKATTMYADKYHLCDKCNETINIMWPFIKMLAETLKVNIDDIRAVFEPTTAKSFEFDLTNEMLDAMDKLPKPPDDDYDWDDNL